MSGVRLLPVLVFGLVSLLSIKLMTIALNLPPQKPSDGTNPFSRSITLAREGVPEAELITGSVPKKADKDDKAGKEAATKEAANTVKPTPEEKAAMEKARAEFKAKAEPEGVRIPPSANPGPSAGASAEERVLLEKLKDRRGEIEARDRDLELRDNLLRLSERKLDERIGELRTLEGQAGQNNAKNDAKARYKPLVVMYESMKPKEAARVFDRLDVRVLIELVGHMNPRKVSEILAVMDAAAAEKLTVALARQASQGDAQVADNLQGQTDTELPRLQTPAAPRR